MARGDTVVGLVGEFLVFVLLILGGGIAVSVVSSQFSAPVNELVAGLGLVAVGIAGVWLVVRTGPEPRPTPLRVGFAFGTAVVVLSATFVTDGDWYGVIGAIVGASLVAGLLWLSQSSSRIGSRGS